MLKIHLVPFAHKWRFCRDVEVVADKRRRAGPENREVRRIELQLLNGLRSGDAPEAVPRESEPREGGTGPRVGLRGPDVDRVPHAAVHAVRIGSSSTY